VVYASQKRPESKEDKSQNGRNREDSSDYAVLTDPSVLRAARQIYRTYYEVHPDKIQQRPLGVAIDRFTHRGKLIFTGKPALLPQECFVPINQIESEMY